MSTSIKTPDWANVAVGLPSHNLKAEVLRTSAKRRLAEEALNFQINQERKIKIKSLVKEMIRLKSERQMDDETFSDIMSIVISKYIENEINNKIEGVFKKPWIQNFDLFVGEE